MEDTALKPANELQFNRYHIDLTDRSVRFERVSCDDLEDALGGVARATKLLHDTVIDDAYAASAPLVMNLGLLTGTRVMTGLRTYFHGYSPLKSSKVGAPGLMWSAGSGHLGTKLRGLDIDEVVFTGRCSNPTMISFSVAVDPAAGTLGPADIEFLDAEALVGMQVNPKIQELHRRYPDAHFAVIGPAGENYNNVRYASIALSTDNQLKSGDSKPRFCGRGGFGGVMGSKNLQAIVVDGPNPAASGRGLKDVNREINLGDGSRMFREIGTWRMMATQHDIGGLPQLNFNPPLDDRAIALQRPTFEKGPYVVKSESCYLCGIKCHKNVYDETPDGEAGEFRVKLDYEPLALLTTNLGIYDPDQALDIVRLCDEFCMDSISLGVTLGYAMEWNRRHPTDPIAGGLSYGDFHDILGAITAIGEGRLPELGQGSLRLAARMGDSSFAMQSKGVEYPAYMPHSNPGYPWALAGGHMSMRTFLLLNVERETGVDYWVDAITRRGPQTILSDFDGLCKFAGVSYEVHAEALRLASGLDVTAENLEAVVDRTFVRGYANERTRGYGKEDYVLPAAAHGTLKSSTLPYFNTPEFFKDLQERVMEKLDQRAADAGFM
ncbi:MAG: aldehyde ferredoxin oxidoreductase C-terminal domain-containing protein [Acidimicrobiia bacterium]|nr:aldehyde ferredoxin oxidoreductase C-terminal domain-containing protein [Acidimicrobiia bacterium]